jgi:hypothetical protein
VDGSCGETEGVSPLQKLFMGQGEKKEMKELLIKHEVDLLIECERVIKDGLQTFVTVGNALMHIRDERLYREHHATFEAYCQDKWGMVASRARQLISAAGIAKNLKSVTTGNTPESERVVRPLAGLPAEEQREVWESVTEKAKEENRKVTAKDVEMVVEERSQPSEHKPELKIESMDLANKAIHILSGMKGTKKDRFEALVEVIKWCRKEMRNYR